ncbi:permease [Agrobacterium deltaense]|nr:permease [Agrobacterium deltaense]
MDFMKLLKSLEELLYELVSWLVFYPMTMWRSVVSPLSMMRYADTELGDRLEDQYDDTLSPPLFLLITLLLSQALTASLPSIFDSNLAARQLGSGSNLLIARGVIFSVYPLCMAVAALRLRKMRLTRNSLRPPFFSQCYVTAPFTLILVLGLDVATMPGVQGMTFGLMIVALAALWYAQAEIRWLRGELRIGLIKSGLIFGAAFVVASFVALALALLISIEASTIFLTISGQAG